MLFDCPDIILSFQLIWVVEKGKPYIQILKEHLDQRDCQLWQKGNCRTYNSKIVIIKTFTPESIVSHFSILLVKYVLFLTQTKFDTSGSKIEQNNKIKSTSMDFKLLDCQQHKKSLKIPKGYSEDVNQRTDNTMAKRKSTNNDKQNIAQKTKAMCNLLRTKYNLVH